MVIERKFVKDKLRESSIKEYLSGFLDRVGFSSVDIKKTPVGFSVIIHASKPGLVVGRGGSNIKEIQKTLESKFGLESPVVDVREVERPELDSKIMAERIGSQLKRFGASKFKAIGHKELDNILKAGAIGAEIVVSGRVPSKRARTWRFYGGYLPKCGEVAKEEVIEGFYEVKLKPGIVGIFVRILPPGVKMPDVVYLLEEDKIFVEEIEEVKEEKPEKEVKEEKSEKEVKEEKPEKEIKEEKPEKEIKEEKPEKETKKKEKSKEEVKEEKPKEEVKEEKPEKEEKEKIEGE